MLGCLSCIPMPVVKDTVSRSAVEAYEKTFLATDLPGTAFMSVAGSASYDRAMAVARDDKRIVFPKASADACLVAAYSLLKCQEVFARQGWQCSLLHAHSSNVGSEV